MKQILWISAIAVTIFALTLNTFAQPGGGGGRGQRQGGQQGAQGGQRQPGQGPQGQGPQTPGAQPFGGAFITPQQLLRNAEVVTMLGLTEEQNTALREAAGQPGGRNAGGGAPGAGERPQGGGQQMTAEERAQRTAEQWANIDKVLKAEQQKKFKEIYFQASVPAPLGPNAPAGVPAPQMTLNIYTLAALDLTADQKEKITKIISDRDTAARSATTPGRDASQEERTAARTAAQDRNTKANDAIKALLTDAQKKKMDELTAGAAELRTKLGLGQPQQRGTGGQRQGGGGQTTGFTPGANSWQPGQDTPAAGAQTARQGRSFPSGN